MNDQMKSDLNKYISIDFCMFVLYDKVYNKISKNCYTVSSIIKNEITLENIKRIEHIDLSKVLGTGKFKYLGFYNDKWTFIRKSDNYNCTVSIGKYNKNNMNLNDLKRGELINMAMHYILSEIVISEQFRFVLLPITNLDITHNKLVKFNNIYENIDNQNANTNYYINITERFFDMMTLGEYLQKESKNMELIDWKILFFQVLYTLLKISERLKRFRHNKLNLDAFRVYLFDRRKSKSKYKIGRDIFYVPDGNFDVKMTDFEYSYTEDYLKNKNTELTSENPYYDIHYFFQSLLFLVDENTMPKLVVDFISEILPEKLRSTDKNTFTGLDENLFLSSTNYLFTPSLILRKNIFFSDFINNSIDMENSEVSITPFSNDVNNINNFKKRDNGISYKNINEASLTESSNDPRFLARNLNFNKNKKKKSSSNIIYMKNKKSYDLSDAAPTDDFFNEIEKNYYNIMRNTEDEDFKPKKKKNNTKKPKTNKPKEVTSRQNNKFDDKKPNKTDKSNKPSRQHKNYPGESRFDKSKQNKKNNKPSRQTKNSSEETSSNEIFSKKNKKKDDNKVNKSNNKPSRQNEDDSEETSSNEIFSKKNNKLNNKSAKQKKNKKLKSEELLDNDLKNNKLITERTENSRSEPEKMLIKLFKNNKEGNVLDDIETKSYNENKPNKTNKNYSLNEYSSTSSDSFSEGDTNIANKSKLKTNYNKDNSSSSEDNNKKNNNNNINTFPGINNAIQNNILSALPEGYSGELPPHLQDQLMQQTAIGNNNLNNIGNFLGNMGNQNKMTGFNSLGSAVFPQNLPGFQNQNQNQIQNNLSFGNMGNELLNYPGLASQQNTYPQQMVELQSGNMNNLPPLSSLYTNPPTNSNSILVQPDQMAKLSNMLNQPLSFDATQSFPQNIGQLSNNQFSNQIPQIPQVSHIPQIPQISQIPQIPQVSLTQNPQIGGGKDDLSNIKIKKYKFNSNKDFFF